MPDTKSKAKRLSGEMRTEHIAKKAFLIEFAAPGQPMDMFGGVDPPLGLSPQPVFSGKDRQSAVDKYRTMERKGFRVTRDIGCLVPDDQYSTVQQGATFKGHQRSFQFFAGWYPKKGSDTRNIYGWPADMEISHLCHRRCCARIDHLIAEEKWRNQKRNYCGFDGECNCGNEVKCLRRYQMDNQADKPEFCSSKEEVKEVLKGAPLFHIAGDNKWDKRDKDAKKRKHDRERKRKQDLHAHATARKQARLGTAAGKGESSGSEDDAE